jgi:hypothetical protein
MISHLLDWLLSTRKKTSVDEDVEEKECLYTVDGNVNWYSDYGNTMEFLRKLKKYKYNTKQLCHLLLDIYPKEMQ